MENWYETGNGKKIKTICGGGVVVISPVDMNATVPLFCPCCKRPMKTADDGISFRKVGVCHKCDDRWTNKPGVLWPKGPDKNSNEWIEYINLRNVLEKSTFDFE